MRRDAPVRFGGRAEETDRAETPTPRLSPTLLIHTQHHGPLGRIEVQPDDVADLVDELRVA